MTYAAVEYAGGLYGGPEAADVAAGTMPAVAIEIAFTTAPGSESPVWVDVSADFVSADINRGRNRELDAYQVGTATITLRNESRAYDPSYTGSPYNGFVKPMKRIRVRSTYEGVTYSMFDGYIDSWDQKYGDAADTLSVAIITASDGFKVLSQADLPSSAFAREVSIDSPLTWFRLGEASGSTAIFDSISHKTALVGGTGPTLGTAGMVTRDSNTCATLADGNGFVTQWQPVQLMTNYPMSLSAIVRTTSNVNSLICALLDKNDQIVLALFYNGNFARVMANRTAPGTFDVDYNGTILIDDGSPHLVTATIDLNGTVTLYTDGVQNGTPQGLFNPIQPVVNVLIGSWTGLATGITGDVDEVMAFNTAVSSTRIAAWSSARSVPWNGDTSGARINRILDAVSWPSNLRDIDTGSSVMASADLSGQSALDHAKKVEASEFGNLYILADGKVRFEGRGSAVDQPSQLTLDDLTPTSSYTDIQFDYSDQLIRNDVTVSRRDGVAQEVTNPTSITSYQKHSYTRDGLIHNSDVVSLGMANAILLAYKEPFLRVTSLTLAPRGSPTVLFPHVLGRELTDRITVKRKPQGVGSSITQTSVIEGIRHSIGAKRWETTWRLSPALADTQGNELSFWQLGVSGHSELGTTNRLYF